MKSTGLFKLSTKDLLKGLITTVLTTILSGVYSSLTSGLPTTVAQWTPIAITGITAGVGYLGKNLLTNSNDQFMKAEPITYPAPVSTSVQSTVTPPEK